MKSAGEIVLSGLRGAKHFSVAFRIIFRILFRVFQTVFRIDLKFFGGSFVLQTCRPNNSLESIRRFARIAWFSRIFSRSLPNDNKISDRPEPNVWLCQRDFVLGQNCQNLNIKLARCLILSVAGFGQTFWRPSCREAARVSTARMVRGVSPGVPQWGATRGQSFLLRKTQECQTWLCALPRGGAPRARLVHSGWENSVNMPAVLANTSTDPSQDYTLFFQRRKIGDFAGPVGDTPKVTLRKSCLAPADLTVKFANFPNFIGMEFRRKKRFWTIFRKFSPSPTPSKTQILLILSFRHLWYSWFPELSSFFCELRFGGLKIANRRLGAIHTNHSHVMRIEVFLRIDSPESSRANRPDSLCESLGHLSRRP